EQVCDRVRRRGLVFLISDCFDEVQPLLISLRHLRFRGHEVTLFPVLHPGELKLAFDGAGRFDALEAAEQLMTRPHLIRPAYLRALNDYLTELRKGCATYRVDYVQLDTSKPLGPVLAEYLNQRLRFRRV